MGTWGSEFSRERRTPYQQRKRNMVGQLIWKPIFAGVFLGLGINWILDNRWHWQEFMLYLGFAFALAGGVVAIVFVVEFFRFLPTLCSSDDSQMMPQYTPGGQPQQQNYNSNQACQPNTTINLTAPTAPQYVSQQQPQMYPPPQQPYTQAYPQPQPPGYKQQPQMQSQEPVVGMPAATSNPTTPTYTLSNVYNK